MKSLDDPLTWTDECKHCGQYVCFDEEQELYLTADYEPECPNSNNGHDVD